MRYVDIMKHWRKQYFPWIITAAIALMIFLFSAQPHSAIYTGRFLGEYNIPIRQCAHVIEFAILFLWTAWAVKRVFSNQNLVLVVAVMFAIGFAFLDEWHQSFVPGRTSTISDVLLDVKGIAFGAIIWVIGNTYVNRKRRLK